MSKLQPFKNKDVKENSLTRNNDGKNEEKKRKREK